MLRAFLASNGSQVIIPDAIEVTNGPSPDLVNFVDEAGRVLVIFRRADVSIFTRNGTLLDNTNGKQIALPKD